MPAEWALHERCWMQWPHRADFIWPDIAKTQSEYADVAKAIRRFEPLTMIVDPSELENAQKHCGNEIDYLVMDLDDSWARDTGPNFIARENELAASIFQFNNWGGKYELLQNEAAVGHRVAEHLGIPSFSANIFLEGGAIFTDGEGTILTTEQCVLNANRNPGLEKREAERILCEYLGGEKVVWLPGDPLDDETDGHIDGVACFVRPGAVLCQIGPDGDDERQRQLHENLTALRAATDAKGRKFEIATIKEAPLTEQHGERDSLSYINFYLPNGGLVMPEFGLGELDQEARATLQSTFPDREIVSVRMDNIIVGGGGIHCITQQQPAVGG